MNRLEKFAALSTLSALLFSGVAIAQDDRHDDRRDNHAYSDDRHDNHAYVHHDEWRKGERIRHEDWDRGQTVDYRTYHLRRPSRGYEWREIDGNYVMAHNGDGVIASVTIAPDRH